MSTLYGDMYGDKKKASLMKFAGFAGVTAVLAAGCFAVYSFSDTVKNQVKLTFGKPEDYLTWVCEKNTNDLAELIGGNYQRSREEQAAGTGASVALRFVPNADGVSAFLEEADLENSGDPSTRELADILRNAQSLSLSMDAGVQGNQVSEHLGIQLNDTPILNAEGAFDLDSSLGFLRIPELTERWIGVDYSSFAEEITGTERLLPDSSSLPSGAEVADSVRQFGTLLAKYSDEVSVERKAPLQISRIQTEYAEISAQLSMNSVLDIAQDAVSLAADDETLKSLFPAAAQYSEFISKANELLQEKRQDQNLTGKTADLKIYVDQTGTIRGYDVEVGSDLTFFSALGMANDQIGAEMRLTANRRKICSLTADAVSKNGALTGKATLNVESRDIPYDTFNIDFSDLALADKEHYYLKGDITVNAPHSDNDLNLTLHLCTDGSGQTLEYPVRIEDTEYGTLSLTVARTDGGTVTVPSSADAFMIDLARPSFTLNNYVDHAALVKFGEETMKKIGFSDETAEKVGSLLD